MVTVIWTAVPAMRTAVIFTNQFSDFWRKMYTFQLCEQAEPAMIKFLKNHLFELKLDGARAMAIHGRLWGRTHDRNKKSNELGRDITRYFPEIQTPSNWVLDGEIVCFDGDLGKVTGRQMLKDDFVINLRARFEPCEYYVFDVLAKDGEDLRNKPLIERKKILAELPPSKGVRIMECFTDGEALWREVTEKGLEGIIAKNLSSSYVGKRTNSWLKIKNWQEGIFPILRYETTVGDRGNSGFVIYIPVPSGEERVVVNSYADQDEIKRRFENKEALKAEIQYLTITKAGRLRKPSFKGLI